MGACGIDRTFKGNLTIDELVAKYSAMVEEDLYENGRSYSGSWGMIPEVKAESKVFDSRLEAVNYCYDNAEKWHYAIAVKFKNQTGGLDWVVAGWAAS